MELEPRATELASVFSLTLHRLQRAPRAIHRAFLSRASLFRPNRNIQGTYHAQGLAFIRDELMADTCAIQMITRAEKEILVLNADPDPLSMITPTLKSIQKENPHLRIVLRTSRDGKRLIVVDRKSAIVGAGRLQVCVQGDLARGLACEFSDVPSTHVSRATDAFGFGWPFHSRVDLESVEVGLSRTRPTAPIEIERLTLEAIRSARRFIYIETKWFTSPLITHALQKRLEVGDGPEVILILPTSRAPSGLHQRALSSLQRESLSQLERYDLHDRLRVYERPQAKLGRGKGEPCHALIIDDQFLKLGTSTLTSSSLGNAHEFDLSIEAVGRAHVVMSIARLRRELIGDLLNLEPSEFDARFLLNGSLIGTIESFFHGERELELVESASETRSVIQALRPWIDPKRPKAFRRWVLRTVRYGLTHKQFASILLTFFALLVTIASVIAR